MKELLLVVERAALKVVMREILWVNYLVVLLVGSKGHTTAGWLESMTVAVSAVLWDYH